MATSPHHGVRFATRRLLASDTFLLSALLVASLLLLAVGIAWGWKYPVLTAWLVGATGVLPIGGYLLFAILLERRLEYEITEQGIWERVSPARRFSIVQPEQTLYEWDHVEDFSEDADLLAGRFGYLEIGLRNPEDVLIIQPARKAEREAFQRFLAAFTAEVELLNQDDTPRAIAISTIRHRPSVFDRRWAKALAVLVALATAANLTRDILFPDEPEAFWHRIYAYFLLVPICVYALRRSFPDNFGGWTPLRKKR